MICAENVLWGHMASTEPYFRSGILGARPGGSFEQAKFLLLNTFIWISQPLAFMTLKLEQLFGGSHASLCCCFWNLLVPISLFPWAPPQLRPGAPGPWESPASGAITWRHKDDICNLESAAGSLEAQESLDGKHLIDYWRRALCWALKYELGKQPTT